MFVVRGKDRTKEMNPGNGSTIVRRCSNVVGKFWNRIPIKSIE